MRKFSFLTFSLGLVFLASCGKTAPGKEEVVKRVLGDYCAEGYRLVLREDSTFYNMRVTPGNFGAPPRSEKCHGTYSIEFDSKSAEWSIVFRRGKAFSVAICDGAIPVWNKKEGWISGDSIISLVEFFDKTPVQKGKCEI